LFGFRINSTAIPTPRSPQQPLKRRRALSKTIKYGGLYASFIRTLDLRELHGLSNGDHDSIVDSWWLLSTYKKKLYGILETGQETRIQPSLDKIDSIYKGTIEYRNLQTKLFKKIEFVIFAYLQLDNVSLRTASSLEKDFVWTAALGAAFVSLIFIFCRSGAANEKMRFQQAKD
jgi:hypothetical protein